jgi:hypothetical protein
MNKTSELTSVLFILALAMSPVPATATPRATPSPTSADKTSVLYYGAKGDGNDNAPALQRAFNARLPIITFPAGVTFKANSGLIRTNVTSIAGNNATLDFSGAPQKTALLTTIAPKGASYVEHLNLIGPGGTSTGLQTNTAGPTYRDVNIWRVGVGAAIGSNDYLVFYDNVNVTDYYVAGFSCPTGLTNAGENVRWSSGGIYNGHNNAPAIDNQRCELNGFGLSIDSPGGSFIKNATEGWCGPSQGVAVTQLSNYHLETAGGAPNGYPVIDVGAGAAHAGGGMAGREWS